MLEKKGFKGSRVQGPPQKLAGKDSSEFNPQKDSKQKTNIEYRTRNVEL